MRQSYHHAGVSIYHGKCEDVLRPTVKPVRLMRHLIELVTEPGDVIPDPFLGSGTTALAAKELGRKLIGIEQNAEYCALAEKRLAQDLLPLG